MLNHLFMVEFVEVVLIELVRLANVDANHDNNITISKEEDKRIHW